MKIFKQCKMMVALGLLFVPVVGQGRVNVSEAIAKSVGNSKITGVSVTPVANSKSVSVVIDTDSGQRTVIVSESGAKTALGKLQDAGIVGSQNASVAKNIVSSNAVLSQIAVSGTVPTAVYPAAAATAQPTPSPAAIVAETVLSSNQQASK